MATEFEKNVSQRTQMGKANEAYKALLGSKGAVLISPGLIEKIVNGGFETGDFTGWPDQDNDMQISTVNPHSGKYCAKQGPDNYFEAIQIFDPQIPLTKIGSFSMWFRSSDNFHSDIRFILNNSSNIYDYIAVVSTNWQMFNLLSILKSFNPTGNFEKIAIIMLDNSGATTDTALDDVSLKVSP